MISSCLELYIARVNAQTNSRYKARRKYLEDRPGTKALSALSRLGFSDRTMSLNRIRLFQDIVHCLVAENETRAIRQWVNDDSESGPGVVDSFSSEHPRWKQYLIRAMVESQVYWTPKPDFTADALTTVVNTITPAEARMATMRLINILFHSSNVCKDVGLYDRFVDTVRRFYQSGNSQRFAATLQLVHPSNPTAALYLKFLRNDAANDDVASFVDVMFDTRSLKSTEALLTIVYQIARVSMLEGRREDAIWVLDFAYGHKPELFGTQATMDCYLGKIAEVHSERNLENVTRGATASEIKAGANVDKAGRLKLDPAKMESIRITQRLDDFRHSRGRAE